MAGCPTAPSTARYHRIQTNPQFMLLPAHTEALCLPRDPPNILSCSEREADSSRSTTPLPKLFSSSTPAHFHHSETFPIPEELQQPQPPAEPLLLGMLLCTRGRRRPAPAALPSPADSQRSLFTLAPSPAMSYLPSPDLDLAIDFCALARRSRKQEL